YVIRVAQRDALAESLKASRIPYGIYYPVPLHQQPVFQEQAGDIVLPETKKACSEVLALPMHTELTPAQQDRIMDTVIAHVNHPAHA
ncbi:MAG: transcriptional regulator, partial [Rhodothermaceae bacterium]|nr:transcriptional regulator [Rhodothermaceae bacterium]